MDQLKDFLRQVHRYRFWILVGVSAVLPLIAYFTARGAIQSEAQKAETAITSANTEVQKYRGGTLPNDKYLPIANAKIETLTRDVNTAWRELYAQQAPLLRWPAGVQEYFRQWGRKWPENVSPNLVQSVINDYVVAYPDFVDGVYKSFSPWNAEDGTGIVAAPPKEALLKPAAFNTTEPPTLGKVWEAQEKLWVQGALLDVVAKVNERVKAKEWETASIKQITALEIGSEIAQDQQSLAKGETLTEPEDLVQPGTESADTSAATDSSGMSSGGEMAAMYSGGMSPAQNERIRFIQAESGQYRVYPVMFSVLIDQNYIQNLLVELANSPMTIQVREMSLQRPKTRVTKPEMGQTLAYGMMGAYGGGMPGMMYSSMMESAYAGMSGGMPGMMNPYNTMSAEGAYGMMGNPMMGVPVAKGKDIRADTKAKALEKAKKAKEQEKKKDEPAKKAQIYDPYYNVVEVQIYGQARFYNPPPEEEPAPTTEGTTPAAEADAGATDAAAPPAADVGTPPPAPADAPATPPAGGDAAPATTAPAAPAEPAPTGTDTAPAPAPAATPAPDAAGAADPAPAATAPPSSSTPMR